MMDRQGLGNVRAERGRSRQALGGSGVDVAAGADGRGWVRAVGDGAEVGGHAAVGTGGILRDGAEGDATIVDDETIDRAIVSSAVDRRWRRDDETTGLVGGSILGGPAEERQVRHSDVGVAPTEAKNVRR